MNQGGKSAVQPTEKAYYRLEAKAVLTQLKTSENGLDETEAGHRLEEFGPNALTKVDKESALRKFIRQLQDLMICLLLASGLISILIGDARTGVTLIFLALVNAFIGFSQEYKAERIMESLEKLVVAEAKVLRNGKISEIRAAELVVGDVVYVDEGASVPADLRLLEESELSTNDFALTGESNPSRKFVHAIDGEVELGNRHNLVFMGTTVATGHAYGIVIATGMHTELGRIASLSADTYADDSPLQKEMKHVATKVTQGTVLLCAILIPVAIKTGLPFKEALLFAIGFASSLIPNGLPAAINTSLARSANKLAKARVLVKKLSAVETLGATSIICTDKTGTLTKNEMTVQHFMVGNQFYVVTGSGYRPSGEIFKQTKVGRAHTALKDLTLFLEAGVFASNATINPPDDEHLAWHCLGDPTEGALLSLAAKAGIEAESLNKTYPEAKEFAFDSVRKLMSSVRRFGPAGQLYLFVKGSPEELLSRSTHEQLPRGKSVKLQRHRRQEILSQHDEWAGDSMRNLAYGYKILAHDTDLKNLTIAEAETDLTFLGLVSMVDPLREGVVEAMQAAHEAHVKVNIITGDYAPTAKAIALQAGLAQNLQELVLVSGQEIRGLDDTRVLQLASRGGVIFSRVSPEDKLRIVNLVKDSGQVVAVTGDGINDAPALKRADIGVAMGVVGSDVAKQSAEIVLLDDSFITLVGATRQGRLIFENIKKSTLAAFTSNSAELIVNLLSLGAAIIFGIPLALTVMLILAIDLVAELFPIAALGWDEAENEIMSAYPRDPKAHILNPGSITDVLWAGSLIGGLAYVNYILFLIRRDLSPSQVVFHSPIQAKAMGLTYLTLVLCLFVNTLQLRSKKGLFTRYQLHNRALAIAFCMSLFWVANIIFNPLVSRYFGTGPLTLADCLFAVGAALVFALVREVQRHANTHHSRNKIAELLHQRFPA